MSSSTTTRIERICISTTEEDDYGKPYTTSTTFTSDSDLEVKLRRGGVLGSGTVQEAVVVMLGIDAYDFAQGVLLDAHAGTLGGTPDDEVLDVAIRQRTIARDGLERIEASDDIAEMERNTLAIGADAAHALGLLRAKRHGN